MRNWLLSIWNTWRDFPYLEGTILNERYRVGKMIGQGSFGTTYQCIDSYHPEKKLLLKHNRVSKGDCALTYLSVESEILKQKYSTQIPGWHDEFVYKGKHFLVVDFIEGTTLDILVFEERRAFSEQQVIFLAMQLLSVIAKVHAMKWVHLDVRLPNVIFQEDRIFLIDFGLARRIGDHPDYIPYEEGKLAYRHLAEPQSDLYAVGHLMLYLLYTNDALIEQRIEEVDHERSWYDELGIDTEFKNILSRLLKVTTPYATAEDALQDLEKIKNRPD
jgi:serine/threonine-protein kinase